MIEGQQGMKLLLKASIGATFLALAACGGQGDDSLGENVQEAYENKADQLDAAADNTSGAQEDALEANASAIRETGEAAEEAIDDADVKVNQQ
jgi:hypothetical protein